MRQERDAETPNGTRPLQPDTTALAPGAFAFDVYVFLLFYFFSFSIQNTRSPGLQCMCVCVFKGLQIRCPLVYLPARPLKYNIRAPFICILLFIIFVLSSRRDARYCVTLLSSTTRRVRPTIISIIIIIIIMYEYYNIIMRRCSSVQKYFRKKKKRKKTRRFNIVYRVISPRGCVVVPSEGSPATSAAARTQSVWGRRVVIGACVKSRAKEKLKKK